MLIAPIRSFQLKLETLDLLFCSIPNGSPLKPAVLHETLGGPLRFLSFNVWIVGLYYGAARGDTSGLAGEMIGYPFYGSQL